MSVYWQPGGRMDKHMCPVSARVREWGGGAIPVGAFRFKVEASSLWQGGDGDVVVRPSSIVRRRKSMASAAGGASSGRVA